MDELKKLKQAVRQAIEVPYIREKLAQAAINGEEDVCSKNDFQRIPFFEKDDLRLNYPFGLFAKPLEQMTRLHASSGTTGKPVIVGYTQTDIENWKKILAEALTHMGVQKKDIVHNAFDYGLFTGGLGWHYGVEALGALVIPISTRNLYRQALLMKDFGATVMIGTPSYGLLLIETLNKYKIKVEDLKLRIGIFGGEPLSDGMRSRIGEGLKIDVFDTYGLSELMGPGVASECRFHSGLHVDGHFYPEIIDEKDQVLPLGHSGELVLTNIHREGSPMLRYRTKDITMLHYGSCPCGFTGYSIDPIRARKDDMIIVKGVNIYPGQIEEVVLEMPESTGQYHLIVKQSGGRSDLVVQIELYQVYFDRSSEHEQLKARFIEKIRANIGVASTIVFLPPGEISNHGGKTKRVTHQQG